MKCAVCDNPMYRAVFLVTRIAVTGVSMTANICNGCMYSLIGRQGMIRLDAALVAAGFIQQELPL